MLLKRPSREKGEFTQPSRNVSKDFIYQNKGLKRIPVLSKPKKTTFAYLQGFLTLKACHSLLICNFQL